jgi:hypothetical protein
MMATGTNTALLPVKKAWPPGAAGDTAWPDENAATPPENFAVAATWVEVTVAVPPAPVDCRPYVLTAQPGRARHNRMMIEQLKGFTAPEYSAA